MRFAGGFEARCVPRRSIDRRKRHFGRHGGESVRGPLNFGSTLAAIGATLAPVNGAADGAVSRAASAEDRAAAGVSRRSGSFEGSSRYPQVARATGDPPAVEMLE